MPRNGKQRALIEKEHNQNIVSFSFILQKSVWPKLRPPQQCHWQLPAKNQNKIRMSISKICAIGRASEAK